MEVSGANHPCQYLSSDFQKSCFLKFDNHLENWLIVHAVALECGSKLGEQTPWANGNEVVMESWRVELVKGNAGELRARVVCARTHRN